MSTAPVGEEMALVETIENLAGVRVAADRLGYRDSYTRDKGSPDQDVFVLCGRIIKDLRSEIVEYCFQSRRFDCLAGQARATHTLAHQRKAGCPAVALGVHLTDDFVAELLLTGRDAACFFQCQ